MLLLQIVFFSLSDVRVVPSGIFEMIETKGLYI
jgi:hypothetical protein